MKRIHTARFSRALTAGARRALLPMATLVIIGLLSANLIMLMLILKRMPPTRAEWRAADDPDARDALRDRIPLAEIVGDVDVFVTGGDVTAEVSEPVEVRIVNTY